MTSDQLQALLKELGGNVHRSQLYSAAYYKGYTTQETYNAICKAIQDGKLDA